ncbi:MAG: flagellar biosynthetic protein FliR [Ignavibacteria bacterium]
MTDILIPDFVITLLIFLRIIAMFSAAPILSHKAFPVLGRILIAAVLAYISFITIIKTTNVHVELDFVSIVLNGVKEVITGLMIGFMLNIIFYGIDFAGVLIGIDMGLSMASVMNPMMETESTAIGELLNIFGTLLFFLINGHHYLIRAIVVSFKVISIGKYTVTEPAFQLLIKYSAMIFIIAIKMAAPIMVSFFLINLAEGIISRAIPQMQVFFVTQPLKIGIGFILLIASLPVYVYFINNLLSSFENSLYELIRAMGT